MVFNPLPPGHRADHHDQQYDGRRRRHRAQGEGQDGPAPEAEKAHPEAEEDQHRRHHGEQGVDPLEPPQGLPHLPLLGQVHGDGVVEGHEQVHPQRVDEQKDQHGPIIRRHPAHDDQPHQYQGLGRHRHPQVAHKAQRRHQHHAQNAGTLPGNLDEPPLDGVDVENLVEVVGKNVAPQAVSQSGEGQHRREKADRLLAFLLGHNVFFLSRWFICRGRRPRRPVAFVGTLHEASAPPVLYRPVDTDAS